MPKFQGETDKPLKVQLKSALLGAQWGLPAVAQGGKIPLEVETQFVADGSDLKLTVKDLEGKVVVTLPGKIYGNFHRSLFTLSKPNTTGGMFFEAELSAHSLKGASSKIRVFPPVKVEELKWLDEKGQATAEVKEGQLVELTAKVQGPKDGAEGYIAINCRKSQTGAGLAAIYHTQIKSGKLSVKWKVQLPGKPEEIAIQAALEKLGQDYFQPVFFFEAGCLGVSAESKDVKLESWVEFDFEGQKGKAVLVMPDGKEETMAVPASGILRIEKPKVGSVQVVDFIPEGKSEPKAET